MSPRAGLWLALLIPLSAAPSSAEETLLGCRVIEAASERLACYDRVVDRVREGVAPGAPDGATSSESEGATVSERAFGRSEKESAKALRQTYGFETPDEIRSSVVEARRGGDRLWSLTLANGQVWRQAENVTFAFRVGDTVEIEAGAVGAYYLRRNGKGRTIRVKRIQ